MDQRTFRRHRKISKDHTKHCWKCGLPRREGCRFSGCNEVQHCACALTGDDKI
jgi:hypothetical protein